MCEEWGEKKEERGCNSISFPYGLFVVLMQKRQEERRGEERCGEDEDLRVEGFIRNAHKEVV